MYLSVIIPCYNEEKLLEKNLLEISQYLERQNYSYEIIVVNDGSEDRTAEIGENLKPKIKNFRFIDNKKNHGKGFVIKQGLLVASGEYRVFTDADNSTPINQLEKVLPEFEKDYDIVIGSRDIEGTEIARPQPWYRIILGNIFNLFVQASVGLWGIWDTQCGFKGLTAEAAEDIMPRCVINRWAFDSEILIIGKKMGYKIKEVPVVWLNRAESRVKFKDMVKMGFDLLKIRWNLIRNKYNLKKRK